MMIEYKYRCELGRVIDGDTIELESIDLGFDVVLKNQRVRLNGIDTPELRTSDLTEKKYGKLAKERVQEFFNTEDEIILISQEFKGKYGRIIGDFSKNGTTLCNVLLSEHHAVPYEGQSKEEIAELHLKNRELLESISKQKGP